MFMLLLTAFQILLYRYSGQEDIVVGTDSANRDRVETENLIGFFINVLALRTTSKWDAPFPPDPSSGSLNGVGGLYLSKIPFDLVVEKIMPDHVLDQMPLVRALFVLQNFPVPDEKMTEQVQVIANEEEMKRPAEGLVDRELAVKFDLAFFMQEETGRLHGSLNYRQDLFAASTIATMLDRFTALLQSIVQQPDTLVDQLNILSAAEHSQRAQKKQSLHSRLHSHKGKRFDLSDGDPN